VGGRGGVSLRDTTLLLLLLLCKKKEMGGACSVYGGEVRRMHGFGGET